ncbi:MAG: Hsp70 family protein [Acidobacteriota bacterium]|nr:Hsp70 family protein [Acidobacteriota bacterium]
MTDHIPIGIDCSDLHFRTAYSSGSRLETLWVPSLARQPMYYTDSLGDTHGLGVGFPRILQHLGTERLQVRKEDRPQRVTRAILTSIREELERVTKKKVGKALLAVPASMTHNNRKTLIECAHEAGLPDTALIDKGTAAVLGYPRKHKKSTVLVLGMSYGECECSLLRLTREHCRMVSTEIVKNVSGEIFNALVVEAIVLALRKKRIFLGLKKFTPEQWSRLLLLAIEIRLSLCERAEDTITLNPEMTGLDHSVTTRVDGKAFVDHLAPLLARVVNALYGILELNDLEAYDIDTFLLAGSEAVQSPVFQMLNETFEGRPIRTDADLIARGAAWQAAREANPSIDLVQTEISPGPVPKLPPALWQQWDRRISDEKQPEFLTVIDTFPKKADVKLEPAQKETGEISQKGEIAKVRDHLANDDLTAAKLALQALEKEVEALKRELKAAEKNAVPRRLIQKAVAMLNAGRLAEAVAVSHQAYQQAPEEPEIFSSMMGIHKDASLAMVSPEQYEPAIQILLCAHSHDQTDLSIHEALAKRHYMHALEMYRLGNVDQAVKILEKALTFDPRHEESNQLMEELNRS